MRTHNRKPTDQESLPSWECGLKCGKMKKRGDSMEVTPFVGVWIEIMPYCNINTTNLVTPFVGVWIEIK